MSDTYSKLASDIVYSSMWGEDAETCKIWITLLALKNQHGIVHQNLVGIARVCNVPLERVQKAVDRFLKPDAHSRTADKEGRRLERVPEGLFVVNHFLYQGLGWSEGKQAYERDRKAAWRSQQNGGEAAKKPPENGAVAIISRERALKRVEARLAVLRGMLPMPKDDPRRVEFDQLKSERLGILKELNYKA